MKYEYGWISGTQITDERIQEFADLYSNHYGLWGPYDPRHGKPVKLTVERLRPWFQSKDSRVAYASAGGILIGYAIAIQTKVPKYGIISWVTQLVVHEEHRHNGVGKSLLFSIWNFSNHFAWGIITANPYAVRALEKSTRRRAIPKRISKNKRKLINIGTGHVPYVTKYIETAINESLSQINTHFFVDHSMVDSMLENVTAEDKPWLLGKLDEGWEWFAFTFQDQEQIGLTSEEIQKMLAASDDVVKQAYRRMLQNTSQPWSQHAKKEVDFITKSCRLAKEQNILDFGCGTGRHVIELSLRGYNVTGIDYVTELVNAGNDELKRRNINKSKFIEGDCRNVTLGEMFDAVFCLYDVIGTYANDAENIKILENLAQHLKPGGMALISVMNFELTARKAKKKFTLQEQPDKLLELPASHTMEGTGDIFNPDYYMIENATKITYRKEQFADGSSLPVELIVRDRRFTKKEIEAMCRTVGFEVIWSRYVRAGYWHEPLSSTDDRAKEILLLCKKKSSTISKMVGLAKRLLPSRTTDSHS